MLENRSTLSGKQPRTLPGFGKKSSSTDEKQVDFGGERFELVTVGCHQAGAESARQGHGETVSQRNPSSLCLEHACSLPKRGVEVLPHADPSGRNGADRGFGNCLSARPVEIVIDLTGIGRVRETIVAFVQSNLPDDFSAGFASQQRDDSAGIENVRQRRPPSSELRLSSSISVAFRPRKSSTLVGTCANQPWTSRRPVKEDTATADSSAIMRCWSACDNREAISIISSTVECAIRAASFANSLPWGRRF